MRIVFMGTPDFAVATADSLLEAGHEIVLVVTQPDKKSGRGEEIHQSAVKEWAVRHNLPVFQPVRIREPECVEILRQAAPDVIVVAAFGQILPKEILDIPAFGCINVHASLLPKYRGAAPIQWAILNGEKETGVTIMQMGVGLDDGDILEQRSIPIDPEDTAGTLFDKLADLGGELCVETLTDLDEGRVHPVPQDESEATHVHMLKKSLGNLDWSWSAKKLSNYVRGLNPWPSAYTFLDGKLLKIWKAKAVPAEEFQKDGIASLDAETKEAPGTVLRADKDGIAVRTGGGVLLLLEVQLQGKKRMKAGDFLLGHPLAPGTLFTK